jgi:hypothetical protein
MSSRRLRAAPAALVLALAGCGGSSHTPSLAQLPLVSGASVVAQAKQCDTGSNAFCAIEAVIVDRRFGSSGAFVAAEHKWLRKLGWSSMAGDNGDQRAAESPGHDLRLTYATAANDLKGWIFHWVKPPRPTAIVLALDRQFIDGIPAMSIMLQAGAT